MKNKNLLIGAGVIAVGVSIYYFLKDRASRRPIGIIDDESVELDYSNATGDLTAGLKEGISLSVNDYKKSIEQTLNDKKYSKYLGRKIYTLENNVNVRMGAGVNNGYINNLAGTIPNKKSFIGKVVTAKLGDDKKIWWTLNSSANFY